MEPNFFFGGTPENLLWGEFDFSAIYRFRLTTSTKKGGLRKVMTRREWPFNLESVQP
jgi:hypothetical protein